MNTSFSPFNIIASPSSGTLKIGREVPLVGFKRLDSTFASASQMDVGSILLKYTSVTNGSSADILFRVSSPENSGSAATTVLKVSATGSQNTPRIGIGNFGTSGTIDSMLHVKGNTRVDGGRLILSADNEDDVTITKRDLEALLDGKPVDQTSTTKRGISRTNTTNAVVSLVDDNTLIKTNQVGTLDFTVSGSTAIKLEKTSKDIPKVMITGSTEVSGSFTVNDLLTVLADYGQTGSFSVSGSTTLNGDINLDGHVNVNDLLEVLAGFNASGSSTVTGSIMISGSNSGSSASSLEVRGGGFTAFYNPPPSQTWAEYSNAPNPDWNPDFNGDGVITVADQMALLGVYGVQLFVDPNGITCEGDTHISGNLFHGYCEPCDEDGHNTITGDFNHAHGYNNTITGNFSFARGKDNTVTGNYGFVMGQNLTTSTEYQTVVGKQNEVNSSALFIVGKGGGENALHIEPDYTEFNTSDFYLKNLDGVTAGFLPKRHALVITTTGQVGRSNVHLVAPQDFEFVNGIASTATAGGVMGQGSFKMTVDTDEEGGVSSYTVNTGLSTTSNVTFANLTATGDTVKFTGITSTPSITTPLVIDSAGRIYTGSAYALAGSGGGGGGGDYAGISASADSGGNISLPEGSILTIAGGNNVVTSNPAGTQIQIDLTGGVLSGSAQIASEISGAIDAATGSLLSTYTFLSSSTQIASEISGAFTAVSAALSASIANLTIDSSSFASDINSIESDVTALETSASAGIRFEDTDSGFTLTSFETASFSAEGEGLTVEVTSNDVKYSLTGVLSSSQQIATDISGAIVAATSSLLNDYGLISSSDQITLSDDDWFIDPLFLTSSRDVKITASLSVGVSNDYGGKYSFAHGLTADATGVYSHAHGIKVVASGTSSYAQGNGSVASGNYSHAEGNAVKSIGSASHAEGRVTKASGSYSHTEGYSTIAYGSYAHAEGYQTTASAEGSHAEGYATNVESTATYGHAEGYNTIARGQGAHAEGSSTLASGDLSHAEGRSTSASGQYSHAQGRASHAYGNYSFAAGINTVASGSYSFAVGGNTHAKGNYSLSIGDQTSASGLFSFAAGQSTEARGGHSFAHGGATRAAGNYSHAEGRLSTSSGNYSHAEGFYTVASGLYSHAEGEYTLASGRSSHADGYHSTASGDYSVTFGGYNTSSRNYGFTIGLQNSNQGPYSFVGGYRNSLSASINDNDYTFIYGADNSIHQSGNKGTIILGSQNTAERDSASSIIAGGNLIVSHSSNNFAHGNFNTSKRSSQSEIGGYKTTASFAQRSHTDGVETYITGADLNHLVVGSHTEGYQTRTQHLIGSGETGRSGSYSHAEGAYSEVYGNYSHAEGVRTIVYGEGAHAEGSAAIAHGDYSHAQGNGSISSGSYTFAAGIETISAGTGSATFGKYNIADTNSGSLLIIGNGGDTNNRRNLATFNSQSIFLDLQALPTTDPNEVGQLWRDGTDLKISLG